MEGSELLMLLLAGTVFFWATWARRRRGGDDRASKAVGYRRVAPEQLGLKGKPLSLPVPVDWEVLSFEDLPHARRRRVLLSIGCEAGLPLERLEGLLWQLATIVQRHVHAHVVVVEAFAAGASRALVGRGEARLLYAVDGQGWSGEERVLATLSSTSLEGIRLYGLEEAQRRSLETLDVAAAGG